MIDFNLLRYIVFFYFLFLLIADFLAKKSYIYIHNSKLLVAQRETKMAERRKGLLIVERPGRCYPAAVLVVPAIACFGRLRLLYVLGTVAVILKKASPESQSCLVCGPLHLSA
jgi:hypothetical protein